MLPDLCLDDLRLWAALHDVDLPPVCHLCERPVHRRDMGYWLGRTWIDWPDPTWRHADGSLSPGRRP